MITSVKIAPNSEYVASASVDGSIKIWDLETKELFRELGRGLFYGLIKIINIKTGKLLNSNDVYVSSISWSPDSTKIAAVYRNGILRIWDIVNNKLIDQRTFEGIPTSVSWSPSGDNIVIGISRGIIWCNLNSETSKITHIKTLNGNAHFVVWLNKGGFFHPLSIGGEHLQLWNFSGVIRSLNLHNLLTELAVSDSNELIIVSTKNGNNNSIVLLGYDLKKAFQIDVDSAITGMAVFKSKNLPFLVTGDVAGNIIIRDLYYTGEIRTSGHAHDTPITDIDWSNDGKYIVAGSSDKSLTIWKEPLKKSINDLMNEKAFFIDEDTGLNLSKLHLTSIEGVKKIWLLANNISHISHEQFYKILITLPMGSMVYLGENTLDEETEQLGQIASNTKYVNLETHEFYDKHPENLPGLYKCVDVKFRRDKY